MWPSPPSEKPMVRRHSRRRQSAKSRSGSRGRSNSNSSGNSHGCKLIRSNSRGEQIRALARESEVPEESPEPELESSVSRLAKLGPTSFCTQRDACCAPREDAAVETDDTLALCVGRKRVFWACTRRRAVGDIHINDAGELSMRTWASVIGFPIAISAADDAGTLVLCSDSPGSTHGEATAQLLQVQRQKPPSVLLARLCAPRALTVSALSGDIFILEDAGNKYMQVWRLPGNRAVQSLPGPNPVLRRHARLVLKELPCSAVDIHALDDGRLMVAHRFGTLHVHDLKAGTLDIVMDTLMSRLDAGCLQRVPQGLRLPERADYSGVVVSTTHESKLGSSAGIVAVQNLAYDTTTGEPLRLGYESVCYDGPWALEFEGLPARSVCLVNGGRKGLLLYRDGTLACAPMACTIDGASLQSTGPRQEAAQSGPIAVLVQAETHPPRTRVRPNASLAANDRISIHTNDPTSHGKVPESECARFNFEGCLIRPRKDGSPRSCRSHLGRMLARFRSGDLDIVCLGSPLVKSRAAAALEAATLIAERALTQLVHVKVCLSSLLTDDTWLDKEHIIDRASTLTNLVQLESNPSEGAASLYRMRIEAGARKFTVWVVCSEEAEKAVEECVEEACSSRTSRPLSKVSQRSTARAALQPIFSGRQASILLVTLHLCDPTAKLARILTHISMAMQVPWVSGGGASFRAPKERTPQRPESASVPIRRHCALRKAYMPRRALHMEALAWTRRTWTPEASALALKAVFAAHDDASVGWLHGTQIARLLRHWLQDASSLQDGSPAARFAERRPESVALYFDQWVVYMAQVVADNPEKLMYAVSETPWLAQSLDMDEAYLLRANAYTPRPCEARRRLDDAHPFWKFVFLRPQN